jgi:hypothetical protein
MATSLRDRLGHFLPRAAAAELLEASAAAAVEGPVEVELDDDPVPETPAGLLQRLAALRGERQQLLTAGAVDKVVDLDAEIARCMVALESAQAQADWFYDEAPARERARAREVWARLEPRLQAVRDRRNAAALEIWRAIDDCAVIEREVAALGFAVEITPTESPVTRWMLQNWIAAHLQRQSQRAA